MGENVGNECLDNLRFAFSFNLQRIVANITHEALNTVTRREPAHRFTEEDTLNHAPHLHASTLAHINSPASC